MPAFDQICSSEYWDVNLIWNTETPVFTPCFLKVALIWGPVLFFWAVVPMDIYFTFSRKVKRIPWSPLNITKLVVLFLFMLLTIADMSYQMTRYVQIDVRPVEYYTPFMLFVTFIAILFLMIMHRRKGVISSGLLFLFWLFLSIGTGAGYYTALQKVFNNAFDYDKDYETYQFSTIMLYFAFSLVEFVLHCFADMTVPPSKVLKRESPEERASFLSKITFWWFNKMVIKGYKKPLTSDDMWQLPEKNLSEYLQAKFKKQWLPLVNEIRRCRQKAKEFFSRYSEESNFKDSSVLLCEKKISKLSILVPVIKTFGWEFLATALLRLMAVLLAFVNPLILDQLISFVGSNDPYWKGFCFAAGMFLSSQIASFFNSQYEYRIGTLAMQTRSCIISILYEKALMLSNGARKDFTVGEIVNLMAVDTQRVMDYVQMVNVFWASPLQIGIAVYFLWQQLGIATLGGIAVMILLIPLNSVISVSLRKLQAKLMKAKDSRTKLMNQILNGIKVLKLYAWESSFIKEVKKIRGKEIDTLRSQAYLSGAMTLAFTCAPFLISLGSFAMYMLIDPQNVLDANTAFVSLSLFNIMRGPAAFLPIIISNTAMFLVSLKRINKFLRSDELDPDIIQRDPSKEDVVIIENGSFSWTKNEPPVLTDVNLRVKEGDLIAVVGQVGAGKSSLLSALLGDMEKHSGHINIKGSVAYVPQQAWIQNATLRKNVLFTKSYEKGYYDEVIEACALLPDLEILPGGDETEIGEKGINLSGGQKQRVSLARAVYNDADIYFLDDPLSAVDVHVGKHIFEKVIGSQGMLKEKTRILVTHRLAILPEVKTIVVLKNGKITEIGSYKELLSKKGAFADFLIQHLQESAEEEILPDEINLLQEIIASVGAPPEITRRLSRISDGESELESSYTGKMKRALSETGDTLQKIKSSEDNSDKAKKQSLVNETVALKSKLIDKEKMEVGSIKSSVYLDYIKFYGYWNCFWTISSYGICTAFNLGYNLWLTAWSNDAMDPQKALDTKLRDLRLGVYSGLGGGEIVFTFITVIVLSLACLRASRILHDGMLEHIMRAPMSFFDTTPLGRILNRFSKDIDTSDVTIRQNFRILLIQGFRALGSVIIISLETPFFLLACLPLAFLYYFLQKFYIPTSRQLKRLDSTARSPIYSHFSETVMGASCIRAYKAEKHFISHSSNLVDKNNEAYYPSLGASRWLSIRLEFFGNIIVFLAAVFAVLARDTLNPGIAGLSVSYALQITMILNMVVRSTTDVETNIVAVERCLEYTKTPTEADWYSKENKPDPSWPDKGKLIFHDYSTRYREGLDLVLKDITCLINPKERCGIIGRTGAGKSSLTLALFRLIEAVSGKIIIDDIEIARIGLHDLRSKITIIPQDPVLFSGTLRFNLDPFGHYSDDALWLAIEQAHLKSFVKSLDKGLEHDIDEGGENLSVGQRQLVCLSRALLRKSKILVLDEATAAVDVETDEVIQATIRREFKDCTVLTIAHRLNTIMDYDKIIVLRNGQIEEIGKPEDLLENEKSSFFSMASEAGLI